MEIGPRGGIITDDSLTTTAPHIYAMGDVRGGLQFTYISLDDFRIVKSKVLGDGSYTLKERGGSALQRFPDTAFLQSGLK
ncbi:MAG: FAD-dependent oxidoreductase [Enterocloster sp.]